MYDYGACHVCGERMESRRVKQGLWIKGKLVVVENVPAGVCQRCGERVVKADVGQSLAVIIEDSKRLRAARRIAVPVVRFAAKVA